MLTAQSVDKYNLSRVKNILSKTPSVFCVENTMRERRVYVQTVMHTRIC